MNEQPDDDGERPESFLGRYLVTAALALALAVLVILVAI